MIELRFKDDIYGNDIWDNIPVSVVKSGFSFHLCDYRIDNVIYTKHTEKFEKAFEKECMWAQLQFKGAQQ